MLSNAKDLANLYAILAQLQSGSLNLYVPGPNGSVLNETNAVIDKVNESIQHIRQELVYSFIEDNLAALDKADMTYSDELPF